MPDELLGLLPRLERVQIAGRTLELLTIDDDLLLDALIASGERDLGERNPYFAQVWPAALAAAEELCDRDAIGGARILDLGCGTGVVGIVAATLGAHVTFADTMPGALLLAERNAERNGVAASESCQLDIRSPPAIEPYPFVVASDLLYEPWQPAVLAAALPRLVEPGGTALVCDPMRRPADEFADLADTAGFVVEERGRVVEGPAGQQRVRVFELIAPSSW